MCEFFPRFLRHSHGRLAGKPFDLLDYQREQLVLPLFGWEVQNEHGRWVRRFTKAYVELPKKNGKSTIAAGIETYLTVGDGEQGAEVYCAATDRNQASIVWSEAARMRSRSPALSRRLKLNRSTKTLYCEATSSFLRPLSARPESNEGWNAHAIVADELHKWRGDELYNALRWAFAAREQPLFFQITTAGDDMNSVCRQQHDYARGVLNGTILDWRFFPLIYAADPTDDPSLESTWRKANPSLGVTISLDSFRQDFEEASRSPRGLTAFKRYRLNVWSTGESPWLDVAAWTAAATEFTEADLEGKPCWAGLDLALTQDTTSLQLIFPRDDGTYQLLSRFWLPSDTAERESHRVPYVEWAKEGLLRLTPGETCDYSIVEEDIAALAKRFQIKQLLFDRRFAEQITSRLEREHGIARLEFGQTLTNFALPTAEFERLVIRKQIAHNGHRLMTWQIGNCQVYADCNNNKRPIKPKPRDYRKVDGVVAAVMALAGALQGQGSSEPSWYEQNEERTVFL